MFKGVVFDISAIKLSSLSFIEDCAKAGVKLGVSGAVNENESSDVFSKLNIAPTLFSVIAYKHSVARQKPHGDVYRYCTLSLGLSNEECIVIETTLEGHRAAKDALCPSVGLTEIEESSSFQEMLENGADLIMPSLEHFPRFSSLDEFDSLFSKEVQKFYDNTVIGDLLSKALEVQKNAYAPYSKFHVGASLLTENGNIYKGCNVENASFGATICAERGASMAALANEGKTSFKLLAVASQAQDPAPPCAICRQFLSEFMSPFSQVYMISSTSKVIKHYSFEALLPCSFTEF